MQKSHENKTQLVLLHIFIKYIVVHIAICHLLQGTHAILVPVICNKMGGAICLSIVVCFCIITKNL